MYNFNCPGYVAAIEALEAIAETADLHDACGCDDWDENRTCLQVRDFALEKLKAHQKGNN